VFFNKGSLIKKVEQKELLSFRVLAVALHDELKNSTQIFF
jgi:hypothetical protein